MQNAVSGDGEKREPPSSHQPVVLGLLWPRSFSSLQDTLHPALRNCVMFAERLSDLLWNESHPNPVTGNCHRWVTGHSLWVGQDPAVLLLLESHGVVVVRWLGLEASGSSPGC